jgi:hypothetical protein
MAINTAALYLVLAHHAALSSRDYMWTPLAWLAWFLYTTHGFQTPTKRFAAASDHCNWKPVDQLMNVSD